VAEQASAELPRATERQEHTVATTRKDLIFRHAHFVSCESQLQGLHTPAESTHLPKAAPLQLQGEEEKQK